MQNNGGRRELCLGRKPSQQNMARDRSEVKGSWLVTELTAGVVSGLVLWVLFQDFKQRVKGFQRSERGRDGEVVQTTLGYKAGF